MPERETKKKKNSMEEALETFMELLPEMLSEYEGQWVVFGPKDKEPVGGFWHCEDDARKVGYLQYGAEEDSFLAREVSRKYLPKEGIAPMVLDQAPVLEAA